MQTMRALGLCTTQTLAYLDWPLHRLDQHVNARPVRVGDGMIRFVNDC